MHRDMLSSLALITAVVGSLAVGGMASAEASSIEVFPASRRFDRSIYFIPGTLNNIYVRIDKGATGAFKFENLKSDWNGTATVELEFPATLEYLGTVQQSTSGFSESDHRDEVTVNGQAYHRQTITLDTEIIHQRIIRGKWYYDINAWVRVPDQCSGQVTWRLKVDGTIVAESDCPIRLTPPIDAERPRPRNFMLFLWYADTMVDPFLFTELAAFYRSIGVTHFNQQNWSVTPDNRSATTIARLEALRSQGIRVLGERGGSFHKQTSIMTAAQKAGKGLVSATAETCRLIDSPEERELFDGMAPNLDGYQWDYEPPGPGKYPMLNDPETIAAFKKAEGITGELTPRQLDTTHRDRYRAFVGNLVAEPVRALVRMLHSTQQDLPIFLCQGSGFPIGNHVDYKLYDTSVDYHLPMIYVGSPMVFLEKSRELGDYLGCAKKVIPVACFGWPQSTPTPLNRAFLDYVGTASLGCAGLAHWPGIRFMGRGILYHLWRAATRVAPVEEHYLHGQNDVRVRLRGIPFVDRKVTVGSRNLDLSQPYWANHLMLRTHRYNDETAVTVINHHADETAYIEIKAGELTAPIFVVDPWTQRHLSVGGKSSISPSKAAAGLLIAVPPGDAGIWLITTDRRRLAKTFPMPCEAIAERFAARQREFAKERPGTVQLGKNGDVEISYAAIQSGNREIICLHVKTPAQDAYFTDAGGRLLKWVVGRTDLVKHDVFEQEGYGMDMLWVPASARWSGDEVQAMRMTQCRTEKGHVKITYEGEFRKGYPGVRRTKTYVIDTTRPDIETRVRIANETPGPVTIAYWSHNVMQGIPGTNHLVLERDGELQTVTHDQIRVWICPNKELPEGQRGHLLAHYLKGTTGRVFGEYYPAAKLGMLFTMPTDFMQLHRWTSIRPEGYAVGDEWMHQAREIGAGNSMELSFSVTVEQAENLDAFKRVLNGKLGQ